ncbi:hypothetical protein J5N97_000905 [Dioscorea zingiberensis]|uniref:Aminotransferase-like plant mobile domain-containing protein n=1 Tax=Dioscorea zingiberensis TaxID=325984 RepID=A0A9D5BV40_9LILI|nr:hypothetical protein J5N97_000905 [Dioscorea zingiberensis]
MLKELSDDKKAVFTEFGFGGLLEATSYSLRMGFVEDLVACVEPATGVLSMHGHELHMTPSHVGSLLGLPCSGPDVDGRLRPVDAPEERYGITRTSLTPTHLYMELLQMPFGEDFKVKLLLYIIGTIIRPIGNVHIATTYLSLLPINEGDIPNLNWANYFTSSTWRGDNPPATSRAPAAPRFTMVSIPHIPGCEARRPAWRRRFTHGSCVYSIGWHEVSQRGQEESSLRNDLNALKMEFERLETHVLSALNDIRRDVACMGHGQPAPNQDATMNDVKEELASLKKKMDEMQGKLDAYKARDENATNPDVGAAMDHRENETRDVSQEDGDVPADHGPTAGPDPDIGVTQELHAVRIPRATRSKKGTSARKDSRGAIGPGALPK